MKNYREQQMQGFTIGDEDLQSLDIDPLTVSDEQFERIVESATEYLQASFQEALHNALQEVGISS